MFFFTVYNQTQGLTGKIFNGYINNVFLDGMISDLGYIQSSDAPQAWLAITLPESIVIRRLKAFTYYVRLFKTY